MTGRVSSTPCRFCGRRGNHDQGCPITIGTPVAMTAWEYGYREGIRQVYIPESKFKTMHPSRVCGYRAGDAWMDDYYLHRDEGEDGSEA